MHVIGTVSRQRTVKCEQCVHREITLYKRWMDRSWSGPWGHSQFHVTACIGRAPAHSRAESIAIENRTSSHFLT